MKATGIVRRVDDPGTDDIGAAAEILFCVVGSDQTKGLETVPSILIYVLIQSFQKDGAFEGAVKG